MWAKVTHAVGDAVNKLADRFGPDDIAEDELPPKFRYNRPEFLALAQDEVQVSRDLKTRPIVVPRDISMIPRYAGYAEVINAGKSAFNEDQAAATQFYLRNRVASKSELGTSEDMIQMNDIGSATVGEDIMCTYYGIFDGHAGTGASLMTSHLLHKHIQDKLLNVLDIMRAKQSTSSSESHHSKDKTLGDTSCITVDDLVTGALEDAFVEMDNQIGIERMSYCIRGGCAVIVALFLFGKLYVANAGDCRAVLLKKGRACPMSRDMTPYSERLRLTNLGYSRPDLLHGEFTCNEYTRRIVKQDLGKQILYRGPRMNGWAYKTADEEDLKTPLIYRSERKSRLLQTIGVARVFGDHDLKVFDSNIWIKPFLSAVPEVRILDLTSTEVSEDDVLIMGSDGLWDVVLNTEVAQIVNNVLNQYQPTNNRRYVSAAFELVSQARGVEKDNGWRKLTGDHHHGSYDDITVFVIPLHS